MQGLNNRANAQANVGRNRVICSPRVQKVSCHAAIGAGIGAGIGGITIAVINRLTNSNVFNSNPVFAFMSIGIISACVATTIPVTAEVTERMGHNVQNANAGNTVASTVSHQSGDVELQVQRRRSI